ncbi:hypothetical protein MJI37_34935, partial [Salmonella enterica subsp. enterica serovar Cerro]|nr:hypothetical protein [Salmonella enterica subsp. enterica serovar Cerro]
MQKKKDFLSFQASWNRVRCRNRSQWAALRDSVPMTLTEDEIAQLKGINEDLSLEEVAEIYLPL